MSLTELFLFFKVLVEVSDGCFGYNLVLPGIRIAHLEIIVKVRSCDIWSNPLQVDDMLFLG
jgi:hypothetical protein